MSWSPMTRYMSTRQNTTALRTSALMLRKDSKRPGSRSGTRSMSSAVGRQATARPTFRMHACSTMPSAAVPLHCVSGTGSRDTRMPRHCSGLARLTSCSMQSSAPMATWRVCWLRLRSRGTTRSRCGTNRLVWWNVISRSASTANSWMCSLHVSMTRSMPSSTCEKHACQAGSHAPRAMSWMPISVSGAGPPCALSRPTSIRSLASATAGSSGGWGASLPGVLHGVPR
mmetsp:Transcript_40246/g.103025  ORF Transcript_40246/g.103025 Transcript_40246/m.103025 type:complete len:228 (+) Transcript_40246:1415-2098(+)